MRAASSSTGGRLCRVSRYAKRASSGADMVGSPRGETTGRLAGDGGRSKSFQRPWLGRPVVRYNSSVEKRRLVRRTPMSTLPPPPATRNDYPTSDGKPMAETDWHRQLMND